MVMKKENKKIFKCMEKGEFVCLLSLDQFFCLLYFFNMLNTFLKCLINVKSLHILK